MMKKTSIAIILLTFAAAASCNILGSSDSLEPGSRDYTWRMDSVYSAPGGWMNTIWGSAPDDVWIASGGGSEKLWHYDGEEWSPYSPRFVGDFHSIYGFSQDNVWMGSNQGRIFHFDGEKWQLFFQFEKEGYRINRVRDIWGNSPSDIYAVGNALENGDPSHKGFILHFNGSQWRKLLMTDFGVQFQRIRAGREGIILRGIHREEGVGMHTYIFEYKNGQLDKIFSEQIYMDKVGSELYYIKGNEIQWLIGGELQTVITLPESENPYGINGRHLNDLFIITFDGVMHYNGEDTQYLFYYDNENASVFRSFVFENDVFFLVNDYDAGTNLIYHGSLLTRPEE